MKKLRLAFWIFGIILLIQFGSNQTVIRAQIDSTAACDLLVENVLQNVANVCSQIGRNEICYGNDNIVAELTDDSLFFGDPGDIVSVTEVQQVFTTSANPDSNEFGVALMDLQVDLPSDSAGAMRLVLFGGAQISPQYTATIDSYPTCQFTNTAESDLRIRSGPDTLSRVVGILTMNESMPVYGQNGDGTWLRSNLGWVFGGFGTLDCSGTELITINQTDEGYIAPMQAITLTIDDNSQCRAAPPGLLIQAPAGSTGNIMVNNVELRIGSTAFITTIQDGNRMVVANLEGQVNMSSEGYTQPLPIGSQGYVPLNDGLADGPPEFVEPLNIELDERLLATLENEIALPTPADLTTVAPTEAPTVSDEATPVTPSDPDNPDAPPAPTLSVSIGNTSCNAQESTTVSGSYSVSPDDDATITFVLAGSSDGNVVDFTAGAPTGARTFDVFVSCLASGTATISVTVNDSLGRSASAQFQVTVN